MLYSEEAKKVPKKDKYFWAKNILEQIGLHSKIILIPPGFKTLPSRKFARFIIKHISFTKMKHG